MSIVANGDTVNYARGPIGSTAELVVTQAAVGQLPGYPTGAAAVTGGSGNVAAAAAVATLTATATTTAYISGFEVTGAGATAASIVAVTVSGLLGGSRVYNLPIPAGATVGIAPLVVAFNPPLPALAINTNIVVTVASAGAGNTNMAAVAHGFIV